MADFTIKQNDTWRPLEARLEVAGTPIDLTDANEVKLFMKSTNTDPVVQIETGAVDIANAAAGLVSYQWGELDTAYVGVYSAEFQIEWDTGDKQTVPNDGYFTVEIVAELIEEVGS